MEDQGRHEMTAVEVDSEVEVKTFARIQSSLLHEGEITVRSSSWLVLIVHTLALPMRILSDILN